MAPSLQTIPPELFQGIATLLLTPDQASLCRTCKTINHSLTPILWREIELHHRGTHEGVDIEDDVDIFTLSKRHPGRNFQPEPDAAYYAEYPYDKLVREPSERKYAQAEFNSDPDKWEKRLEKRWSFLQVIKSPASRLSQMRGRRNFQFGREELFVCVRGFSSRDRWDDLAQHVRSLCMSIGVDGEVAEVIGSFPNLTSLELIGLPLNNGHSPLAPDIYLPKLQNLKLRGYLSGAFVRNVCNNAKHIKHLDIGILATPTDDKAYRQILLNEVYDLMPVTEEQADNIQRNGAEAVALANDSDNNKGTDTEYSDDENDHESRPWALHAPIWLPRTLPARLTSLTHLHLVKPYTGQASVGDVGTIGFRGISGQYEQLLCLEWAALLKGVAATLKEVILEHRIPQKVGDTVRDGDSVPNHKGSYRSDEMAPHLLNPDWGDVIFCRKVLPLFLEQSGSFASLRRLVFRGIQVKGIRRRLDSIEIPGENGVPDNDELLQKAYRGCDIEIFEESYPIHVYAGDVHDDWSPHRHESTQDQGDGLLYDGSFYNDYKKRFGPQWKIVD
ncbi:hypothetical protein PFICI_14777 [Pestalotiopsis fici W106-1]|uniref:F-box domain-containing protein n=1 Tax=Pestalotiopsis fici (strain W106-1 / CGMCC3.15140) TaxID=1229662 RepID=W3WM05_PESFW|nr:uncharacterized protein PFICI_14777 [Pestalotiopsis fici W106-1]ETS73831.1 hypothetical protein PFICI_14777 [Pestalotiopsis fici W106-1]